MSAKSAIQQGPRVILIAEDDANDVLLLKRAFTQSGLKAAIAFVPNGLEAIRYLQGQPPFHDRELYPFPDLLLLDLNMPGAGGLEVLEWLASKPEWKQLRLVVFSSCAAPADSRRATSLGALTCLSKPLNPRDLLSILDNPVDRNRSISPQEN